MASSDWKSQLAEFFYDIEQLAKVLLWEIGENPEAERPFDEEFRKFILEESNNRLSIAYSAVQEELQQLNDPVENNENANNPLNLCKCLIEIFLCDLQWIFDITIFNNIFVHFDF